MYLSDAAVSEIEELKNSLTDSLDSEIDSASADLLLQSVVRPSSGEFSYPSSHRLWALNTLEVKSAPSSPVSNKNLPQCPLSHSRVKQLAISFESLNSERIVAVDFELSRNMSTLKQALEPKKRTRAQSKGWVTRYLNILKGYKESGDLDVIVFRQYESLCL